MKRRIKFRIWDKLDCRYIYPDKRLWDHYIITQCGEVYNLQNGAGPDDFELQQWTGLVDKNGVDIYEGDIVRHTYTHELHGEINADLTVIYNEHNAWFTFGHDPIDKHAGYYWIEISEDAEVIGNTFEKP